MKQTILRFILAGMIFFTGCKTLEPKPETFLSLTIPEKFSIETETSNNIKNWQMSFGNDELVTLIKDALQNNFDLKILRAKIDQAKAQVKQEQASFFPDLGFSVGGERADSGDNSFDASLNSSYTADVFGKTKAENQAGLLNLEAAKNDLRSAALELTKEVAQTWIDIIAVRNEKIILNNQIKDNKILLKLQRLRFANGKASALDVSQQQEALAEANSAVPLLEKQERLLLNSLGFLLGKTDAKKNYVNTAILPEPMFLSLPKIGIPIDLLYNRPDIQAAKMRLSSSKWEITASKADLLPSFTLTAQSLFSAGTLDLLFSNWVATLAGVITGDIFDGGLKKAQIKQADAYAKELLNSYAKTVAQAIYEVEDSLVSIQKQKTYIDLLEQKLIAARLTFKDAKVQYQNGQTSYLSCLTAWASIEKSERQLIKEKAGYIKEQIKLCKALGFSWH